ncbi:MAG: hypothetical protein ACXWCZ_11390 [Flavisolibacter sp.]
MKKLFILVGVFSLTTSIAQKEKFDIVSFIPPTGWHRIDTNGMLAFIRATSATDLSDMCQIFLYPGRQSSGNGDNDFKTEWKNRVVTPMRINTKPKTEKKKNADGWNIISGSVNSMEGGINYKCRLVTASGFGKTMSVLVIMSGNYTATVNQFLNDMHYDKNATVSAQSNIASSNNQTNMNAVVTINDYVYTVPDKWFVQKNNDFIQLSQTQTAETGCFIRIISPQPSSGNPEQDVKNVFNQMYAGWQYRYTGERQHSLHKGFTAQGLEYSKMEAGMSITKTDGRYDLEEGSAVVIKIGNQIVILAARHERLISCECKNNYNLSKRFLNSFTIKNAPIPANTVYEGSNMIVGYWKTADNMVISDYVFAANGRYQHGGAIATSSTSSDFNYQYLHIKSYSWQGDGSYSISGNQLTLRKSGDATVLGIRFEKVNHGGTGWKERMYILRKDNLGESEAMFEKHIL